MAGGNICCGVKKPHGPQEPYLASALAVGPAESRIRDRLRAELKEIPGGFFDMGARQSRFAQDLDSPRRRIGVSGFAIGAHSVTNAQFKDFVDASGYQTVAEREGWSYVFHLLLRQPHRFRSPPGLEWWKYVEGACWHHPEGPESTTENKADHPVVHVSWYDALAYCRWSGLRLPYEAEWERAARGGVERQKFPWGNTQTPAGQHQMNTWQGIFPLSNTAEDGFSSTAPATAFRPNGYGLYNMTGNVWEWVQDWFGPLADGPLSARQNPQGNATGSERVQRGGSYLCHESYCDRYHVHSRTRAAPDSSTGHCGFRVAAAKV